MSSLLEVALAKCLSRKAACFCLASLCLLCVAAGPAWGKRGKCLNWERRSVDVQKCARYSSTGHCAHWTNTTKSQKVCTRREGEVPRAPLRETPPHPVGVGIPVPIHQDWIFKGSVRYKASRSREKWYTYYFMSPGIESFRMSDHDRFKLEADVPEQWKAAGWSQVCEFSTYGYAPYAVACQNVVPVSCDGRLKLCSFNTEGKLAVSKLSPKAEPADYFGNRKDLPHQPAAYFRFEAPGWEIADVTCDCEIPDKPTEVTVALPVRDVFDDLDCRTAADCYQKGSELQLGSALKIRYHEAACFAGSPQACSDLGASLLDSGGRTQARLDLAKSALARACYHRQVTSCERLGQFLEESAGEESGNDAEWGPYNEIRSAMYSYEMACAGEIRSACDRQEVLSPLVVGFDQRRKECRAYSVAKDPQRKRECELAAVNWLAASQPASARLEDASEQPNSDTDWNQESFARLFPAPAPGWSVSDLQVEELEGFMQGLSAWAGRAKPVRYQLSRTYSAGARAIEVTIDSENLETAGLVLLAHGHSHQKDGKPVPLSAEKLPARAQLLAAGVQPVMRTGHLAAELQDGSTTFLMLLLGDKGVLGLGCETTDCLPDVEALLERLDLSALDRFARFDHRESD